jgi:MFS family permease
VLKKKHRALSPEEKFIVSGTSGVGFTSNSRLIRKLFRAVPVLKNKNCRLYFAGQLISIIGSWMQVVALGWLTLQLTNSAFLVGLAAAMSSLPALFFSLFGGVIVDSFSKKSILLITNFAAMILAFVLGFLVIFGKVNIVEVMIIALLGGIINAVFTPAHFAYLSELADKKSIPSAMSINASISSTGRIIGPALAGIFIVLAGSGGAFILNGISYIAVLVALLLINTPHKVTNQHLHPLQAIKEGLVYSAKNPMIRSTFIYVSAMSIFAWSYTTIIPIMAKDVFRSDATGMGYLFSAVGIGAIVATVFVSVFSKRFSKLTFILAGNTLFSLSLFMFSFTSNLNWGIFYLFLAGAGLVSLNVVLGTMIQLLAAEKYRGRVTSIYFLVYAGLMFLGNLEIGYLTDHIGSGAAIRLNTIIVLVIGVYIYFVRERVRESQKTYLAGN